jgi:nucleotide-binding universal stress UspA family protein
MGKYSRLLVAFDGSESSRNALRQAIRLAIKEGAFLKVITVTPGYEGELDLTGIRDVKGLLEGPARKLLEEAGEIAAAEGFGVETAVEEGTIHERIVETAEKENFDLIIVGRRGLSRLERMLMGSVTSRVIGSARKDVLVVPRDSEIGWEHILVATDGSEYGTAASARAINFARFYGGDLTAVSVVDVTDELFILAPDMVEKMVEQAKSLLEEFRNKAESSGIKTEVIVREGSAFRKILEIAHEKKASVIFMGSHGRRGIAKLLMGSVTEKVIGHATCPVIVIKPH